MSPHVYLFADGSSGGGGDIGSYATLIVSKGQRKLIYGTDYPTTIARMELKPIIEGLRWINKEMTHGTGGSFGRDEQD